MAGIINRRRWTTQPTRPLQVDWSHPLARGLIECGYVLGGLAPYSAVAGPVPTINGTGTPGIRTHGHGITVNASPNYISLARNISASGLVASSMVRTTVESLSAAAILLASSGTTSTNYAGHFMDVATSGALNGNYGDNAGAGGPNRRTASSATGVVVAGVPATFAFVCRAAADWSLYKDGRNLGTPTYSGTTNVYAPGAGLGTINFRNAGSTYGNQTASSWAHWSRALNDDEMQALYEAPFQFLQPIRRRVWVAVGGTPAFSSTSDTLAFASQSVTAIAGRASGADAVALGLTDAGAVAGRMAGADVVGALLQSAGAQAQRLQAADATLFALAGAGAVAVRLSASDVVALGLLDAAAARAALSASDVVALLLDANAVQAGAQAEVSASDSVAFLLNAATAVRGAAAGADALALGLNAVADAAQRLAVADAVAALLDAADATRAALAGADALALLLDANTVLPRAQAEVSASDSVAFLLAAVAAGRPGHASGAVVIVDSPRQIAIADPPRQIIVESP